MITDPGTTPVRVRNQIAFGLTAAAAYGVLVQFHVVFGLFFALFATCVLRGIVLAAKAIRRGEVVVPAARAAIEAPLRESV
jgi:hypothetical protein